MEDAVKLRGVDLPSQGSTDEVAIINSSSLSSPADLKQVEASPLPLVPVNHHKALGLHWTAFMSPHPH